MLHRLLERMSGNEQLETERGAEAVDDDSASIRDTIAEIRRIALKDLLK